MNNKTEINLTEEIVTEICGHIRIGVDLETALRGTRFNSAQIYQIQRDLSASQDPAYIDFSDCIKMAEAQFEIMQLMKINADGGAGGAKWLLERIMPKKWGSSGTPRKKDKTTEPELESDDLLNEIKQGEVENQSLITFEKEFKDLSQKVNQTKREKFIHL